MNDTRETKRSTQDTLFSPKTRDCDVTRCCKLNTNWEAKLVTLGASGIRSKGRHCIHMCGNPKIVFASSSRGEPLLGKFPCQQAASVLSDILDRQLLKIKT